MYLRIAEHCPGLYANDPKYSSETALVQSHGEIREFKERDYGQRNRVCIVITKPIVAEEADVEIWVTYNLAEVNERVVGQSTFSRRRSQRRVGKNTNVVDDKPSARSLLSNVNSSSSNDDDDHDEDDIYDDDDHDDEGDD